MNQEVKLLIWPSIIAFHHALSLTNIVKLCIKGANSSSNLDSPANDFGSIHQIICTVSFLPQCSRKCLNAVHLLNELIK